MISPGWLLRRLRTGQGLTLRELADRGGTSSATLSDYEMGRKVPRIDTLQRLVGATGHELVIDAPPRAASSTREERRSRWLHTEVAARLRSSPTPVLRKARANLATMRRADEDGASRRWLDQWDRLLDQPVDAIVGVVEPHAPAAGKG